MVVSTFFIFLPTLHPQTQQSENMMLFKKLHLPFFSRSCVRPVSKFAWDSVSYVDQSLAAVAQGSVVVTVDAMASYQCEASKSLDIPPVPAFLGRLEHISD